MNYVPKKEEIKILKFLSKQERGDDGRKLYDSKDLEKILILNHSVFAEILTSGTPFLKDNDGKTWITSQGDSYINNYNYETIKEFSYWIFGLGALVAAVYSVIDFYCK